MTLLFQDSPFHVCLNSIGPHQQPSETLHNSQYRHLWQISLQAGETPRRQGRCPEILKFDRNGRE